ncbi:aspartic proteinase CDR1 [Arachis duranensis]|uniref:Aspartic proteinase CDR1 n=1 Tax=Arachis duranensis TaxID=130453 RepID=A0A6P4BLC6_ARADU|nr:aspartic proteinase CDR1 [Arachis duranensis]
MHSLLLLLFSFSAHLYSLSNFIPFVEATKTQTSFTIDLIHHDSPLSPFYDSSMTSSDIFKKAALRSIARYSLSESSNQFPESIVFPNGAAGDYLTKIYIGTPPVERIAVADTGSDLIWVQCSQCDDNSSCFSQDSPLFDPNNSSTYTPISCTSENCTLLYQNQRTCGTSNVCEYSYRYADDSYTKGELASDSISFDSTSGVTFPNSIFGCGHNNTVTFNSTKKATGVVGLGAGPLSLVSQLGDQIGHKFSYCLVSFGSNSTSKLKFGDDAIISGNGVVSTPLTINSSTPTYYNLNLEGITVGNNTIQSTQNSSNIIIDSGTTFTYLDPSMFNDIVTLVTESSAVEAVQDPPKPYGFCGSFQGSSVNVPEFVFHFTGADVALPTENMYTLVDNNLLCLLLLPNTGLNGLSLFGNLAQMNFQVEYDLQGNKVSFAPANCTNSN